MAIYKEKIIKKIPGELPPPPKKECQGYIEDLSKLQRFEVMDLLERQNKILSNKKFISKLPDKGERIISFRDRLLKELDHRNEVEKAANLLSRLNIASEGKKAMSELEWTGKYTENKDDAKVVELNSDDEDDPLKILAQPTGTGVHKKKIVHIAPEESFIKPEDIEEIESFKTDLLDEEHVKYIVEKVERSECKNNTKKGSFKPYKPTKSNVHDPSKERERKNTIKDKKWEVTAATPPLPVHGTVKTLSLNESLILQKEQTEKLQEIQAKHAAERLAEQLGLHSIEALPQIEGKYRSHEHDKDSEVSSNADSEEEHEVHDEEDNDKRGTVVYTVDSIEC